MTLAERREALARVPKGVGCKIKWIEEQERASRPTPMTPCERRRALAQAPKGVKCAVKWLEEQERERLPQQKR